MQGQEEEFKLAIEMFDVVMYLSFINMEMKEKVAAVFPAPETVRVVPGKSLLHLKPLLVKVKRYSAESMSLKSLIISVESPRSGSTT